VLALVFSVLPVIPFVTHFVYTEYNTGKLAVRADRPKPRF
jgi:hypothetical protein